MQTAYLRHARRYTRFAHPGAGAGQQAQGDYTPYQQQGAAAEAPLSSPPTPSAPPHVSEYVGTPHHIVDFEPPPPFDPR
jgi:hypothetical protein